MESFNQFGQLGQMFGQTASFFNSHPVIFGLLMVWTLVWKGLAVWKAARLSHRIWFIIILVANTAGILEIIYLFFVARKYSVTMEVERAGDGKEKVGAVENKE